MKSSRVSFRVYGLRDPGIRLYKEFRQHGLNEEKLFKNTEGPELVRLSWFEFKFSK